MQIRRLGSCPSHHHPRSRARQRASRGRRRRPIINDMSMALGGNQRTMFQQHLDHILNTQSTLLSLEGCATLEDGEHMNMRKAGFPNDRVPTDHLPLGRGCTVDFSRSKTKNVLVLCRQEKKKPKRRHKEQLVPPPKSVISTFDDGGQYPTVDVILLC